MEEEHLDQTGVEADEPMVKPEHSQRDGHCGQGEAHVGEGQHGQEVVHGLRAGWGPPHSQRDQAVSSESQCTWRRRGWRSGHEWPLGLGCQSSGKQEAGRSRCWQRTTKGTSLVYRSGLQKDA